jgi:hypothetical protein
MAAAPHARSLRDECRRQRGGERRRMGTASHGDIPRAHRWELLLSVPSVYAFSDHSPIVTTFED